MEERTHFFEDDIEKLLIGNLLDGNDEQQHFGKEKCAENGKENRAAELPVNKAAINNNRGTNLWATDKGQQNWPPGFKGRTFYPASSSSLKWQFWPQRASPPVNGYNCDYGKKKEMMLGFGPFHAKSRYVSESQVGPNWSRMREEYNDDHNQFRPMMFGPKRSKSQAFLNNQQRFNNHSMAPTKQWQPPRPPFNRTNSKPQMPPNEKNTTKPEEKQQILVKNPPSVPIGFCPIEEKRGTMLANDVKMKEKKPMDTKGRAAAVMPEGKKSPSGADGFRQLKNGAKVRTISLSKMAKMPGMSMQAPSVDGETNDDEQPLASVGRFQALSHIDAVSASKMVQEDEKEVTGKKQQRQRRANSVTVDSIIAANKTTPPLVAMKRGTKKVPSLAAEPMQDDPKTDSPSGWKKLVTILLTLFPLLASMLAKGGGRQSDDCVAKGGTHQMPQAAAGKSGQTNAGGQKRATLRKQHSQNGSWKSVQHKNAPSSRRMAIFGAFVSMLGLIWKNVRWTVGLLWECLRLCAKFTILCFNCFRGRIVRGLKKVLGYG